MYRKNKESNMNYKAIGIAGFQRPKNMLLNVMIGEHIIPNNLPPEVLVRINCGLEPQIQLITNKGSIINIPAEGIKDFYDSHGDEDAVSEICICYPCWFCGAKMNIIGIPEADFDTESGVMVREILPYLSGFVMIISADRPLSEANVNLLQDALFKIDLKRWVILTTKMDIIPSEAWERTWEAIKKRLSVILLNKVSETYSIGSEEYEKIRAEIDEIVMFPVSPTNFLMAVDAWK